jgi:hypothetical protein
VKLLPLTALGGAVVALLWGGGWVGAVLGALIVTGISFMGLLGVNFALAVLGRGSVWSPTVFRPPAGSLDFGIRTPLPGRTVGFVRCEVVDPRGVRTRHQSRDFGVAGPTGISAAFPREFKDMGEGEPPSEVLPGRYRVVWYQRARRVGWVEIGRTHEDIEVKPSAEAGVQGASS